MVARRAGSGLGWRARWRPCGGRAPPRAAADVRLDEPRAMRYVRGCRAQDALDFDEPFAMRHVRRTRAEGALDFDEPFAMRHIRRTRAGPPSRLELGRRR